MTMNAILDSLIAEGCVTNQEDDEGIHLTFKSGFLADLDAFQRACRELGAIRVESGNDKEWILEADLLIAAEWACPACGERRSDFLVWNDLEQVACATCGKVYDPNGSCEEVS
jgi:rubredoxin